VHLLHWLFSYFPPLLLVVAVFVVNTAVSVALFYVNLPKTAVQYAD